MIKPTICNSDPGTPVLPEFCDDGLWEVPVNSLSEIKKVDRDHAYILPNDSVWVLSHDSKKFIPLNLGGGPEEGQPTQVTNNDGLLSVEGSGTYSISVDLNVANIEERMGIPEIEEKLDRKQDKLTAGKGILISDDNEISASGQLIKVTKDTGEQIATASGNKTLLQTIIEQGVGVRAISASPSATDNPTNQALRGTALLNSATSGNFIGMSEDSRFFARSISSGKWYGEWQTISSDNAMIFQSLQIKAEDWNTLKTSGIHWVAGATGTNRPAGLTTYGYLEIFNSSGAVIQRYTSNESEIATRYYSPSADKWSAWVNNLNNTTGVTINGSQTVTGTKDFLRGGLKVEGREVQVGYSILTTLSDLAVDSSFIDLTGTLSRVGNTVHLAAQFRIDKFTGEAKDLMQIPVGYQREPRNPTNLPLNLMISDPTAKEHVEAFVTTGNVVKIKSIERSGTYVLSGSWTTINRFPT